MSISLTRKTPEQSIMELSRKVVDLQYEVAEARRERDAAVGQLEKKPELMWWAYAKMMRQKHALDTLNRRVISQRMALREIERLGRGLTKDEYQAARESIADEKLRERIGKEYAVTI